LLSGTPQGPQVFYYGRNASVPSIGDEWLSWSTIQPVEVILRNAGRLSTWQPINPLGDLSTFWSSVGIPVMALVPESYTTRLREAHRARGLKTYLDRIQLDGFISVEVKRKALLMWQRLYSVLGARLSVPDACPDEDGQILYTWDRGEHHFEVEIAPDGDVGFFYMNRIQLSSWERNIAFEQKIPAEVHAVLRLLEI